MSRHILLTNAAKQNYEMCYHALKSLESHWQGIKYIVTVLDQKAKGVSDPLLYTTEEIESALELPLLQPSFDTPGWRKKPSWSFHVNNGKEGFTQNTENMNAFHTVARSGSAAPNQSNGMY